MRLQLLLSLPCRILRCCSELKKEVDRLNHEAYNLAWSHLHSAIDNVIKGARYHRVDPAGDSKDIHILYKFKKVFNNKNICR